MCQHGGNYTDRDWDSLWEILSDWFSWISSETDQPMMAYLGHPM